MPVQFVGVQGLEKALSKLAPALIAQPIRNFYQRATLAVVGKAKPKVPVDNGALRARLMNEVDNAEVPLWGKAGFLDATEGSEVWYQARAMEYGTGRVGDKEVSHKEGHFPPGAALDVWAARHGFESGYQVARIIAKRGGLLPRRMLRDGLRDAMSEIQGFLNRVNAEVKELWEK